MSTTLAQAATLVADKLMDGSGVIWTPAELKVYVKRAHRRLVADTKVLWTDNLYDDDIGNGTMDVPSDLLLLTAVTWDSYPIPAVRMIDLVRREPGWLTKTGNVEAYCMDGDGVGTIRKVYIPAADATDKFGLEYYQSAKTLSADGTAFELLDWMIKYVVYYACYVALSREGDGQDLVLANHYMERYAKGVITLKDMVSSVNAYRMTVLGSASEALPSFGYRLPANYGRKVGR